ncbi:MAG TPA: UrcA family protein [Rhizomicrobium sp.]|jgi:UrcA family protein|nr:UrcA family protein [Rhizomicrobium sp.]
MQKSLKLALFAGAMALTAASANAQDYGYQNGPTEEVQVIAPQLNSGYTPLNGPLEKASLSVPVRYDDLNLRTRRGARELHLRVQAAAQGVCMQLADVYPVQEAQGTSCYKAALQNASVRANEAIDDARANRSYYD